MVYAYHGATKSAVMPQAQPPVLLTDIVTVYYVVAKGTRERARLRCTHTQYMFYLIALIDS